MTRFARAKGSKASNEKLPEDATPWSEMKTDMQSPKQEDNLPDRSTLLKSFKDSLKKKNMGPSEWAEISNEVTYGISSIKEHMRKSSLSNQKPSANSNESIKKKPGKKQKSVKPLVTDEEPSGSNVTNTEVDESVAKKKKKKNKKLKNPDKNPDSHITENVPELKKPQKRKSDVKLNTEEKDTKRPNKLNTKLAKNKKGAPVEKKNPKMQTKKVIPPSQLDMYGFRTKEGKPVRKKKKTGEDEETININGQNVTIVKFDGYYVKKEDAVRLEQLKKDMYAKGIPRPRIIGAIQLERRRAEKALVRLKKKVCFKCRMSGHNISDCPEIVEQHDAAINVCYRCGSTEHTYFQCKNSHSQKFAFAECFICNGKGHISRQCPDNPRGIYPHGGACNLCSQVDHLRENCPNRTSTVTESLTAERRNYRNVEGLDDENPPSKSQKPEGNKKRQHIRF